MVRDTRFYDRLGIDPSATFREIRRAYMKAALDSHPDKNRDKPEEAATRFIHIQQAYEILSDESKRRIYDNQGPAGLFGRSGVPAEADDEPAYRPRPGATPNYGGTSFNYRASSFNYRGSSFNYDSYSRARSDEEPDDEDDDISFDEDEIRRLIRELLKKRYNRARGHGGSDEESDEFAPLFSDEEIKEMLRPSAITYALVSLLDTAINAAAGAAAAATGAHANGSPVTPKVAGLGALAGLTKSVIVTFAGLSKYMHLGPILEIPFIVLGSGMVVCLLITVEISGIAMGQIPWALCVAALIAGFPLWVESICHLAIPSPSWLEDFFKPCIFCFAVFSLLWPLYLVAFDALGGFVYALVAKTLGMPICALHAAAAAGAVYGTVAGVTRSMVRCFSVMCICCFVFTQLVQLAEQEQDT